MMKSRTLTLLLLLNVAVIPKLFSQNVSINSDGSLPDISAMLDVSSTDKGFLLPRMTTTQQDAILLPANGLAIFNITLNSIMINTGTSASPAWTPLSAAITLTTLGTSGIATLTGTTLNIPDYASGPGTGTVTSIATASPITGGNITTTGTIGIDQATSTTDGYLSSADWNTFNGKGIGTVTSIGTSNGIAGGTITGTGTISGVNTIADGSTKGVASFTANDFTDNGNGIISIDYANGQPASAINNGFLSSIDWATFNSKSDAITLTTLGTSGIATLTGTTLNIPDYASGPGTGTVTSIATASPITGGNITTTGTIGIDQATSTTDGYLSSADWNTFNGKGIGTVTSIGTSNGISGGTITGTGTISGVNTVADGLTKGVASFTANDFTDDGNGIISIDYTNGQPASAGSNGFLSSTDWATFNSKSDAITLTTIGTGGAATLTGTTLNIPDYAPGTGTVTNIATGYGLSGGPITATGTIAVDSAALSLKYLKIIDTANIRLRPVAGGNLVITGTYPDLTFGVNALGTGSVSSITTTSPITGGTITTTGTIGIDQATSTTGGYLSSADWNTFNGKGIGTVTSIGTSNGISGGIITGTGTISGVNTIADGLTKGVASFTANDFTDDGNGIISIDYTNGQTASAINKGFLSGADWTTFNSKSNAITLTTIGTGGAATLTGTTLNIPDYAPGTGTVTNIATGYGLSGGPVTVTGTIAVDSAALSLKYLKITDTANIRLRPVAGGNLVITGTYPDLTFGVNALGTGSVSSITTTSPITGGTITTTGTIGIDQATGSTNGYLSAADWNTFSGKPNGTVNNLTENNSSVLVITGGASAVLGAGTTIEVNQANALTDGYLSQGDWNGFNNKVSSISLTVGTDVIYNPLAFVVTNAAATGALDLKNQVANVFFAGGVSGTGKPTFRTIVPADLPLATAGAKGIISAGNGLAVTAGVLSVSTPAATKIANYTVLASDYTIVCNNTLSNITLTLPSATAIPGKIYVVKKISAATFNVTIAAVGGETIDGLTSQALSTIYSWYTIQSDGTNWIIIGN